MEETTHVRSPHLIILPSPGMGHLIPLTELAKQLVLHHNFSVTFTIPGDGTTSKPMESVFNNLPHNINHIFLPPVSLDDLPKDTRAETKICLILSRSMPSLREAFKTLTASNHVVALVTDLFGTDGFDVAKEFKVPSYLFFLTTALCLTLFLNLPKLDEAYSCEYKDIPEPLQLPGCVPIHGSDLLDPVQDRTNDAYKWILHCAKRYKLADGILLNSFMDLEPGAISLLTKAEPGKPPIYPIGPLIRKTSSISPIDDESGCLKWLDNQPHGSVLYISFGSGGTHSVDQLTELAFGLEMSKQRFLWVVRKPKQKKTDDTYLSANTSLDPLSFLPEGFLDRTRGLGLVVPLWAPQIQVLGHASTGGFLTHCGWNSILESIVNGVPLIAWPLYAEQKMNAKMLVEDLKISLRPKANEDGLIGREEIARVVNGLMDGDEGKTLWGRMSVLKEAASTVLSDDGTSTKTIFEVANIWKNQNTV